MKRARNGSEWAFSACQIGSERWLKQEIARLRPSWKVGFSRPGLLTFKVGSVSPDEWAPGFFSRAFGCSGGSFSEAEPILDLAHKVGATHLWLGPRDPETPADTALASELELHFRPEAPRDGDTILDVITAPGEPALVGWHVHGPWRHRGPVGRIPLNPPEGTPSRAWAKLVEALDWARISLIPGETVIEIGAAPGGATRAMLDMAVQVIAVDAQPMDPSLLGRPNLTWIQKPVGEVGRFPEEATWIVLDANIPPAHAVASLHRLVDRLPNLKGLLLTLKLTGQAAVSSIPDQIAALKAMGAKEVRGVQLSSNRADLFVYARLR